MAQAAAEGLRWGVCRASWDEAAGPLRAAVPLAWEGRGGKGRTAPGAWQGWAGEEDRVPHQTVGPRSGHRGHPHQSPGGSFSRTQIPKPWPRSLRFSNNKGLSSEAPDSVTWPLGGCAVRCRGTDLHLNPLRAAGRLLAAPRTAGGVSSLRS